MHAEIVHEINSCGCGQTEAAAGATISSLIDRASNQLKLASGWKGDLNMFCRNMRMVRDVLRRADEKNVSSNHSKLETWLQDLRDIADEADDLLEEVAYEMMRRDNYPKWKKVSNLFTLSNPLLFRLRMANKAKDLKSRLAVLNANATSFGLHITLATAVAPMANPEQTNSLLSSQVVGRDDDVSNIVSLLTDSTDRQHQDLPVTVIVGMPGLGKTTLAKAVSRTDKICQHFGNILWVCVSENFDRLCILKMMLESLGSDDGVKVSSEEAALRIIQDKLGEKGFLLILDDVWNEERLKWEGLRSCLLGISKNKGSRVLVTTRSQNVAEIMTHAKEHIYCPKKLEDDKCWTIIKQRAFGGSSAPQELEEAGKGISGKCKGVPLVASLIGATLQNRRDLHEWELILQDHVWSSLERENGVLDIVRFSYDRLPELALKQCFAFCSIFPKDTDMKRDVLIQLWMAQGFLSPPEDSSVRMEDIGEKYYRYFLSYSLFQEESNIDFWGRVRVACKMHDLIHDFAQSISQTAIVDKESVNKLPSSIRHLNVVCGGETVPTILRDAAPKLRTLLFSENDTSTSVRLGSKRLRVLSISKASDAKQLSTCFGDSKSLRYLDISRTEMEEFPKFIKKLYNLQTFRCMYCKSLRMPAEGLRDLLNLSHIYFSDEDRMPANLGSLTNLQTLKEFYVGKTKGRRIEELGSLRKLRGKLTIHNLERVEGKSEAESAKLHEKALDELRLEWSRSEDCDDNESVLEGLQPHSGLQKLAITGFGGTCLPSWMLKNGENRFQFNSLVVLKIESCKRLKSIPVMEGFSSLKELSIGDCEELSDGAFTFQSLKKLSIWNCRNVESLSFSGLASLEELDIYGCGVVSITGDGLSSCTRLRTVAIMGCGELACLPSGWSSCTALEVLFIYECSNLIYVPEELKGLRSLVEFVICFCPKLSSFPEEMLGCLSKLKRLKIGGFSNDELEEFPGLGSINNLSASLEHLTLYGWEKLSEVPSQIQALTTLKTLKIEEFAGVEALPEWLVELKELRSLVELRITYCPKLRSFPEEMLGGLTRLTRLKVLEMGPFCKDLEEFIGLSSIHSSLEELKLYGWEKLAELPQQIQHLTALRRLMIWNFKGMEALPDWLANLPALETLRIEGCPKLKTLPSSPEVIKRLSKLNGLYTYDPDWPELKEMIRQEKQSANQSQ